MYILLRQLHQLRNQVQTGPDATKPRRGSLALRHVDAGSCNGCEHELGNAANPFYDLSQYGISVVASPRHADILVITGQITTRMVKPLRIAYEAMPEPRLVAALGDCARGHNVLGQPAEHVGPLDTVIPVDIVIPGCPPHPRAIISALTAAMRSR